MISVCTEIVRKADTGKGSNSRQKKPLRNKSQNRLEPRKMGHRFFPMQSAPVPFPSARSSPRESKRSPAWLRVDAAIDCVPYMYVGHGLQDTG